MNGDEFGLIFFLSSLLAGVAIGLVLKFIDFIHHLIKRQLQKRDIKDIFIEIENKVFTITQLTDKDYNLKFKAPNNQVIARELMLLTYWDNFYRKISSYMKYQAGNIKRKDLNTLLDQVETPIELQENFKKYSANFTPPIVTYKDCLREIQNEVGWIKFQKLTSVGFLLDNS